MKNELSFLERSVLEKILDGDIPLLIQLRQQIARCIVVKREYTGFGFYATLSVPADINRTSDFNIKLGDVVGEISGLTNGAGFLLYIKDGVLDMLEGYSYDEPWPISIPNFNLKYLHGEERDWLSLEKILCKKS